MRNMEKIIAICFVLLLTTLVVAPAVTAVNDSNQPRKIARPLGDGNIVSNLISYLLGRSLKETMLVFTKLSEQYDSKNAEQIVTLVEEAIMAKVYLRPGEYLSALKEIAQLEREVGNELKGQVSELLLQKYQLTVEDLIRFIDKLENSSGSMTKGAAIAAMMQLQVCRAVKQMLKNG